MDQGFHRAIEDTKEWIHSQQGQSEFTLNTRFATSLRSKWTKPESSYIKCSYDCSYRTNTPSRAAWILRDSYGFCIEAGKSIGDSVPTILESELQALVIAIQHVWSRGYWKVIFEGDNKSVFNLLTDRVKNFKVHN